VKIVTVVGARPQFVKAAAVSRAIAFHNAQAADGHSQVVEVVVHTGQHFDVEMSGKFFDDLSLPRPNHHLNVHSLNHGAMTGRILERLEALLLSEGPDWVLIYGDTNSTLAGALAAKKLHYKVAHVEAGLRSFNRRMPEEINRVVVDHVSDLLCCPTENAVRNLFAEGVCDHGPEAPLRGPSVINTGDVMLDAALFYGQQSSERSHILHQLGIEGEAFVLCTFHRAENTDDHRKLNGIVSALNELSRSVRVVLPLHPRTRNALASAGTKLAFEPISPVGYFDMIQLLKSSQVVLTDSGGLQKEACFFGRPCVTLRAETEWTELIEAGVNRLAGAEPHRIIEAYQQARSMGRGWSCEWYGSGNASARIVAALVDLTGRSGR
jgi:UDP-GlcNAc3NAcA epimerase